MPETQSPTTTSRARVARAPLDSLPDDFIDYSGKGPNAVPTDNMLNCMIALKRLGLDCSYNTFKGEYLISGRQLSLDEVGELSDHTVLALRHLIRMEYGFEPSGRTMQDAATRFCAMRSFHPVKQYFASLPPWDGVERVERLLPSYFNTPDTPYTRAVSRIMMVASVRRILTPGTKYDYMLVLCSAEGYFKSTAIQTLYGADHFTDQSIIGLSAKDTEEALRGIWANECPELSGISKADWNRFKASLSRSNDRTRRVYARNTTNAPRTSIPWGTTNDTDYLRALSGMNRRFLPADVLASINVANLVADRDQLWAEALALEAMGEGIALPEEHWPAALEERQARTEVDPWEDELRHATEQASRKASRPGADAYEVTEEGEERISTSHLFDALTIPARDRNAQHGRRIGLVMRSQGWTGPKDVRIGGGKNVKGYTRLAPWLDNLM